ncbi:hypothetical protein AAG570_003031, partial [Ranatra chinensis]
IYQAHHSGRKAELLLKKKHFDDALECHARATEWLSQAMQLTNYSKCLESLKLQCDFHLRQTEIIRAKKVQFEAQKQLLLFKKKKMEKKRWKGLNKKEEREGDLQIAIYRTMEEADSLLGMLTARGNGDENTKLVGTKHPKDDGTVMEELRTVNCQLRTLVNQLLAQLDAATSEAESLRTRLRVYEPNDHIPDLAPLEMPHFDFSTI